jgi:hypothetical protein
MPSECLSPFSHKGQQLFPALNERVPEERYAAAVVVFSWYYAIALPRAEELGHLCLEPFDEDIADCRADPEDYGLVLGYEDDGRAFPVDGDGELEVFVPFGDDNLGFSTTKISKVYEGIAKIIEGQTW